MVSCSVIKSNLPPANTHPGGGQGRSARISWREERGEKALTRGRKKNKGEKKGVRGQTPHQAE